MTARQLFSVFALGILVLGACTNEEDLGSRGGGRVHESPSPQCHDVAPSTRAPEIVLGEGGEPSGGALKDGRYELSRVVEPTRFDGDDSPEVFEVRGGKIYHVIGDYRSSSEWSLTGTQLDEIVFCRSNDAGLRTAQNMFSETATGFKLHLGRGAFEYIKTN